MAANRRPALALAAAALALAAALAAPAPAHAAPQANQAAATALAGRALDWAEANATGHTYAYGAAGPGSYDCSGLVMAAYAREGVTLPHNTGAMLASGQLTEVPVATAPRGALLFFGTGHVEFKTIWHDQSFGAHSSSDPIIGWQQWWPGSWQPTAAYVVIG